MSSNSIRSKQKFPISITRGSVEVKIYRTLSHGCESFVISHYFNGKRNRQAFSNFTLAKNEAESVAGRLGSADSGALSLTGADRAAYQRARQLLDPINASIENAAEFFVKRHPSNLAPRKVIEVVDEMLKLKQSDGLSAGYLKHLSYDLNKFADAFQCSIGSVSGQDIDSWLRGLGVSPRTRNNLRNSVQTLFAFAKSRKYLPKDHDEIDAVTRAKNGASEIKIFTPEEIDEILTHADERLIPFLTLGAFAGIRHAEIQRLDWSNIHFEGGIVEIGAAKAKTASRRALPILDNLRTWLLKHRQEAGPVCVYKNMASEIESLVRAINTTRRSVWATAKGVTEEQLKMNEKQARQNLAKIKAQRGKPKHRGETPPGAETAQIEGWKPFAWKHNALRHSFISYRVAQIQNVAQVALEAGNSPQIIFSNYRELVRHADAEKWFSIVPKATANLIQLPTDLTSDIPNAAVIGK